MKECYYILFSVIISLMMAACDKSGTQNNLASEKEEALATIEGNPVYLKDLKEMAVGRGGHLPGKFDSMEEKKALLEELIRFEVLAEKAEKSGYGKDPEIVRNMKKMMVQKYWQDQLKSSTGNVEITDDEVKKYYDEHINDYTGPEMARASILFLKFPPDATDGQKQDKRKIAESILRKVQNNTEGENAFAEQVKKFSDDIRTKSRGGDIGWVPKGARIFYMEQEILDSIFSLRNTGDFGPIIATSKGLYLVQLTDSRQGKVKSLASAEREIRKILYNNKKKSAQENYYQTLKKEFDIQINETLLKSLDFSMERIKREKMPPSFPVTTAN